MTSEARVFCSQLARDAHEPLAGTASHARGCVLLTYPKRLWGTDALASEGLPSRLKDELLRLLDERDVITRFLAHDGDWNGRTELTFFPEGRRCSDVPIEDAAALLACARREEPLGGAIDVATPIVAVCTHGQRDRCCALFGLALVEELRRVALESGVRVDVREASHLGGDRFAPTVLVLPSGDMYGHLEPSDAAALLSAAAGGPALLAKLRGSLWLAPHAQLAEIAAYGLAVFRDVRPAVGPIAVTDLDRTHRELRATVSSPSARVTVIVRCAFERRQVFGDCRNAERQRRGGVDAWTIESVRTEPAV
jgi:hypothetical protein